MARVIDGSVTAEKTDVHATRKRTGDCQLAFTLPHWMMALAATGREDAARRMLAALRESPGRVVTEVALPVCEAVAAHRRGDHERAVSLMTPVLGRLQELGGSHAQRDVLEQLYFDACLKGRCGDEAKRLLDSIAARFPVPPSQRVGYRAAAI